MRLSRRDGGLPDSVRRSPGARARKIGGRERRIGAGSTRLIMWSWWYSRTGRWITCWAACTGPGTARPLKGDRQGPGQPDPDPIPEWAEHARAARWCRARWPPTWTAPIPGSASGCFAGPGSFRLLLSRGCRASSCQRAMVPTFTTCAHDEPSSRAPARLVPAPRARRRRPAVLMLIRIGVPGQPGARVTGLPARRRSLRRSAGRCLPSARPRPGGARSGRLLVCRCRSQRPVRPVAARRGSAA